MSSVSHDLLDALSEVLSHITAMAYALRENVERPEAQGASEIAEVKDVLAEQPIG